MGSTNCPEERLDALHVEPVRIIEVAASVRLYCCRGEAHGRLIIVHRDVAQLWTALYDIIWIAGVFKQREKRLII